VKKSIRNQMILIKTVMTRKGMKTSTARFADKERQTSSNTHRLHGVVSHNTILSANEPLDFTTLFVFFFCSFTDKILKS